MKTNLLRLFSILILATIVLTPGQGLGAWEMRWTDEPRALAALAAGITTRVSISSDGYEGNSHSYLPSISANGRYIAFFADATNLVEGDTNKSRDAFVHDQQTGDTTRVSVSSNGNQGNSDSGWPSISADGRYVAFMSGASNLVGGDSNGWTDVFVYDRQTGDTTRVSVSSNGDQGNSESYYPAISADGRYVAFVSGASNLVSGDTNGWWDVFVHDRQTGITGRVSVSSSGEQGDFGSDAPSISADGRYMAFQSMSTNFVDGDTGYHQHVFVHDRETGITERVSVSSEGEPGDSESYNPVISVDGRYVAFSSYARNLAIGASSYRDIYVHDRQTGSTMLVSGSNNGEPGNDYAGWKPSISADGRLVTFDSQASNLVSGDTNDFCLNDDDHNPSCSDVFVYDRQTGITERVSVSSDGNEGNSESYVSSISADGRFVAFYSSASNLVSGDTNEVTDVFLHDRGEMNFVFYLPVAQNQP